MDTAATADHIALLDDAIACADRAMARPGKVGEDIVYQATIVSVIDGDTLKVAVPGFPAYFVPIDVRVYGCDAPEHEMPPAQSQGEVALGQAAKAYAAGLVQAGEIITLTLNTVRHDKYGRLLATVRLPDGRDWGETMIAAGHARPYGADGNLHKEPWC